MSKVLSTRLLLVSFSFSFLLSTICFAQEARLPLAEGWTLQSSARVSDSGQMLSLPGHSTTGWYTTTVPATVLTTLVNHNVYPNPDFGMNLRQIPGTTYPAGENFSNISMQPGSPFAVPWWYRTEFEVPASYQGKQVWLNFEGINYRANVWLNGKQIASEKNMAGMWRTWEFNVTDAIHPGEKNALAVEVFAPQATDLAITFVDWNPLPPDKDMGLWRGVYLATSGPAEVRHPHVLTDVNIPSLASAHLTVTAELHNATGQPVKGTLKGAIGDVKFDQPVELAANETKEVEFTPQQYSQLNISNPRLWWPWQMGAQNLYGLHLEFDTDGGISDQQDTKFGIRQVTSEMNPNGYRVFSINGKRIVIRGGGWSPDMMLRQNPQRLEDEFRLTKDMGLNTIRLEGKLETEHFFDLADRYGILIMAGWCCCDAWEKWPKWPPENFDISQESLRDQIRRLRNHPSLFVWLDGSDNPPPPDVEQNYLNVLKACRWPNPVVSSATAKPTSVTGNSGVKMTGPYEYVAPSYWETDKTRGGAYGFNTETSPGPAIPVQESLEKFIPKDKLWPISEDWGYHAGGGAFKDVHVFTEALNSRYGTATDLQDYDRKAQLMGYEGIRAMFEAYSRDKYNSTGVIQWMLNNAWPSVIWHLFDYYLQPAGGYFGAKKATELLHAQYDYDDHSISLVSSQYTPANGLKVTATVYNLDMKQKFNKQVTADAGPDSSQKLFALPSIDSLTPTYFLRLTVDDSAGKRLSTNTYWLSTKPEKLDWEKSTWYYTPTAQFADYTALKKLPTVKLNASSHNGQESGNEVTHVTLSNPSKSLAFFVRLKLAKGKGGQEVLPVIYQDNYFSLLPGEKRDVSISYRSSDLGGARPVVEVSGWNVAPAAAE
ncbi:MAG TPA: glycoside hydrolase family 2 protein [Terriglobales bacterium]|nr:glycoside hydrolase family 2 protein [Terriglobales bacterium]